MTLRTRRKVRSGSGWRDRVKRAALVPRPPAPDVPIERLDDVDLRAVIEAGERIIRARIPHVDPKAHRSYVKPIRRDLAYLAAAVGSAIDALEHRAVTRSILRPFVRKATPADLNIPASVWSGFEERLTGTLSDLNDQVRAGAYADVSDHIGIAMEPAQTPDLADRIGTAVTRITEDSRAELAAKVETATERGYSIDELVNGSSSDGFTGLRDMVDRWQAENPVDTTTDRATLIAETETANAYNLGSMDAYEDSGLVEEVNVYDGPECGWTEHDDPELANGMRVTLDEANDYPISHPHCQRAFGPVVEGAPRVGAPGAQVVTAPLDGPRPTDSALETQARAVAARAFSLARGAEGDTTALMRDLERISGGTLQGLEFRLKADIGRTIEKVTGDVRLGDPLERARQVKDALRYTLTNDEATYWQSIEAAHDALVAEGNVLIKYKSNWTSPLSKDVNTAWRTPNGSRFELQFHTPESFARKNIAGPDGLPPSHAVYDDLRRLDPGDPRRGELESLLERIWEGTPEPLGDAFRPSFVDPDLVA